MKTKDIKIKILLMLSMMIAMMGFTFLPTFSYSVPIHSSGQSGGSSGGSSMPNPYTQGGYGTGNGFNCTIKVDPVSIRSTDSGNVEIDCLAGTGATNLQYRFDVRQRNADGTAGSVVRTFNHPYGTIWGTNNTITLNKNQFNGIAANFYVATCTIRVANSAQNPSGYTCGTAVSINTTGQCTANPPTNPAPQSGVWRSPFTPVSGTVLWSFIPYHTSSSRPELACTWTCPPGQLPYNGQCVIPPNQPQPPQPGQCWHGEFQATTTCQSDPAVAPPLTGGDPDTVSHCNASATTPSTPQTFPIKTPYASFNGYTGKIEDNVENQSSNTLTVTLGMGDQTPTFRYSASGNILATASPLTINMDSINPEPCRYGEVFEYTILRSPWSEYPNFSEPYQFVGSGSASAVTYTDLGGNQLDHVSLTGVLQTAGLYKILISYSGREFFDGTEIYSGSTMHDFHVFPNTNLSGTLTGGDGAPYADNHQTLDYTLTIADEFGNPPTNKCPTSVGLSGSGIINHRSIKLDMVNNTGATALTLKSTCNPSNFNGTINPLSITSYTPGDFHEQFLVRIPAWDNNYNPNGSIANLLVNIDDTNGNVRINEFKKPFRGVLEVSKDGVSWDDDDKPAIGTMLAYRINPTLSTGSLFDGLPIKGLPNRLFSLSGFTGGHVLPISDQVKTEIYNAGLPLGMQNNGNFRFNARLNFQSGAVVTEVDNSGIEIRNGSGQTPVEISYSYGSPIKVVKYYLSDDDGAISRAPISLGGDGFHGVKVVGGLQGVGKHTVTGQKENISDISMLEQRTLLRRNAYTYVRSMTHNTIVNGVKYFEGDITLSKSPPSPDSRASSTEKPYETLVVLNGNVTIAGNLTGSTLGIIVLQDGYDANNTSKAMSGGNVFITPNVTNINAIIYADGGIVSAELTSSVVPTVVPYTKDSVTRTSKLLNALEIKGSIFTRNTIGGAILKSEAGVANRPYILPGGTQTNSFDTAMIYDLNYLRRGCGTPNGSNITGNINCSIPLGGGEQPYPLTITYDASITSNPPKLFEIRK